MKIFSQLIVTAKTFLKKVFAAHFYKPTNKINADILLFKPTENYAKLAKDYGLNDVKLISKAFQNFFYHFFIFSFSSATTN